MVVPKPAGEPELAFGGAKTLGSLAQLGAARRFDYLDFGGINSSSSGANASIGKIKAMKTGLVGDTFVCTVTNVLL